MHVIDLSGKTFARWTVVRRSENTPTGQAMWLCRCECGTERALKSIVIRRGISQSCGCWNVEVVTRRSTKHGHASAGKISPTYHSWAGMLARCRDPNHNRFSRYGGRGISVCERWLTFANFLADMGEKPPGKSIERRETDGNYEPGNCVWATATEQARNKSNNRHLTVNGETKTIAEWAQLAGLTRSTFEDRLASGWSVERALSTPAGTRSNNAKSRMLTVGGETKCVSEWARSLGIDRQVIYTRLHRGASDADALRKL